ncbi:MAG TPA: diguanylate cyclase [Gemmatimonadales bacterium]|nr:diguanylate cyclase [Gemmatimonadales bacterium]
MSGLASDPGAGRPRVLLLGDAAARPYGLERALSRAGFHVIEAGDPLAAPPPPPGPDVAVICAEEADAALGTLLQALNAAWAGQVPLIVVLASPDREGPARALGLGADDALAAPIHLPELSARVEARSRRRPRPADRNGEGRMNEIMLELIEQARAGRRPAELLEGLIPKLARALPGWEPSFIAIAGEGEAAVPRVLAGPEGAESRELRIDLDRYPEVGEALRSGRPVIVPDVRHDPLFEMVRRRWAYEGVEAPVRAVAALPLSAGERVLGVLLLRARQQSGRLTAGEEAFALQVARAAARLLEPVRAEGNGANGHRETDPLTGVATLERLDRRIVEESERARRYSLTFSLVLLDVDEQRVLNERLGRAAGDQVLSELGRLLQREVRASDFVARYGGDEFALVLAETGATGARELVHRIRHRLSAESFAGLPPGEQPRVAAGIVAYPHPAVEQTGDLVLLLEAALRRGKAQSEERIGIAE